MDIIAQFAELFEGRRDAYGTDDGGCVRVHQSHIENTPAGFTHWQAMARDHLEGYAPLGVYPLKQGSPVLNDWYCKWGCVDLDVRTDKKPSGDYTSEDECHIAAVNLQKTLKHFGVTSWIERTRSNARHLWVFASTWVPASVMRRALLVATSVADVSSREVNPKQETLSEGQVGSYVRLPYPGGGCPLTQSIIVDGQSPIGVEYFVQRALHFRTPIAKLEHIASLYREPVRTPIQTIDYVRGQQQYTILFLRLNALAKHLLDKPVDQISDRSMHIEAFVRASKDSGLTASETLTLADELAARCGKFDGRTDRERQLRVIVERAWT